MASHSALCSSLQNNNLLYTAVFGHAIPRVCSELVMKLVTALLSAFLSCVTDVADRESFN